MIIDFKLEMFKLEIVKLEMIELEIVQQEIKIINKQSFPELFSIRIFLISRFPI